MGRWLLKYIAVFPRCDISTLLSASHFAVKLLWIIDNDAAPPSTSLAATAFSDFDQGRSSSLAAT